MITQALRKIFKPVPVNQRYAEDVSLKKNSIAATLTLTQDDIYESLYPQTRKLFHDALQDGRLSREQVLYIKYLLNEFLQPYRQFYPARYKNDAHEIYSKLKSPFLDNTHFAKLNKAILGFIKFY